MSLAGHVDVDSLVQKASDKPSKKHSHRDNPSMQSAAHGARYLTQEIPKHRFPEGGCDAEAVYQLVHDQIDLDGRPNLNLASFVHADKLMMENISKNLIDEDEYPATVEIHHRCISMIAHLWHNQKGEKAVGTATTGSSEGIMLGGMAMKRNWQNKMKAAGKSITEPGPNIIMGANAQVCLEKFARYWDVEARLIPVTQESRYCLDVKKAAEAVDENTIGVFVIMGSTYTGHYENVQAMSDELDKIEKEKGWDVPIHVDAASGGFFAPFATPQLKWDFRLPRVKSIQSSGHKFGLAGVGWVLWRDAKYLPKDFIFELHYLGATELSFSLNFSRPAAPIISQYFSFLHLGFDGYRRVAESDLVNARMFSRALEQSGQFKVLSEIHREAPKSLPGWTDDTTKAAHYLAVSFALSDEFKKRNPDVQQKWIQTLLRVSGFIVPNYALPPATDQEETLRVVVRESTSEDLLDDLLRKLFEVTESLDESDSPERALATLHAAASKKKSKASQHGAESGEQNTIGAPC